MRNTRITICLLCVMLALIPAAKAENFDLTGNQHKDVTNSYDYGHLWDSSTADVLDGGYIQNAYINDEATLNVNNGDGSLSNTYARGSSTINVLSCNYLGNLYTYDNSTVNLSVNSMYFDLKAYDNSIVNFSGPGYPAYSNGNIKAYGNSTVNVSGGELLGGISAHKTSNVIVSNGYVDSLAVYDNSTLTVSDGHMSYVYARDNSIVNFSGGIQEEFSASGNSIVNFSGYIGGRFCVYDNSTVNISSGSIRELGGGGTINISGGSIGYFDSFNTVTISGGDMDNLQTYNNIVNISGGSINNLVAWGTSTVIFDGYDFELGVGLSWDVDGGEILGTGIFTGKWFDGTSWSTNITDQDATATIMAIPEPTTIALIVFGGLALRRRK